jgi:hypothetical protein
MFILKISLIEPIVTYGGVSSGQKLICFLDNLSHTTGIFLGFIKHKTPLRAGFPKAKLYTPFLSKKFAFP